MSIPNPFRPVCGTLGGVKLLPEGCVFGTTIYLPTHELTSFSQTPNFETEFEFKALPESYGGQFLTYLVSALNGAVVGDWQTGLYALQHNPNSNVLQFHNNTRASYYDNTAPELYDERNVVKINSTGMVLNGVFYPGGDGVTALRKTEMNQLRIIGSYMAAFVRLAGKLNGEKIFDYRAARKGDVTGIYNLVDKTFIEL